MRVEQRWTAQGRTSWCIIDNDTPYPFGSAREEAVRCMQRMERIPLEQRSMIGYMSDPSYSLMVYPINTPGAVMPTNTIQVQQRWDESGNTSWGLCEDGVFYNFVERETAQSCMADCLRLGQSCRHRYCSTARYPLLVDPNAAPPPPALVPPCGRCGAEIHVSKWFSNGRPCKCLET